jgi:hypothetical protein
MGTKLTVTPTFILFLPFENIPDLKAFERECLSLAMKHRQFKKNDETFCQS